ncbi:serine protease inhibitor Kazal-type 2 [Pseudophryne corroboree]|uniref:serine protease inhibitor Kazal-type 2 n=1 Tax=Pseudophryne corroboree TaxID=495146 RepID=UPI0030814148
MKLPLPSVMLLCIVTAALWPTQLIHGATLPKCYLYQLPGCPRDLNPVCGTDGKTYANECMLCASNRDNGLKVHIKWKGEC